MLALSGDVTSCFRLHAITLFSGKMVPEILKHTVCNTNWKNTRHIRWSAWP